MAEEEEEEEAEVEVEEATPLTTAKDNSNA